MLAYAKARLGSEIDSGERLEIKMVDLVGMGGVLYEERCHTFNMNDTAICRQYRKTLYSVN